MSNLQEVPTDELLVFQDFPVVHQQNTSSSININSEQAEIDVNLNENSPELNDPLERNETNSNKISSIWSLEYYQRFFDVDTKDVCERIMNSMIPKTNNQLLAHITQKPDFYGPFWISITLIFTIAISGNISNYLQTENSQWRYDFKLVSYAATAIWIYVLIVPLMLWSFLTFNNEETLSKPLPGIFELICIYGYSLFIYIPIAILWSIQISNLQWFLAIGSSLCSGSVLLLNLMSILKYSKRRIFLIIAIISCNLLLAAGFMLYFFHVPNNSNIIEKIEVLSQNVTEKSS